MAQESGRGTTATLKERGDDLYETSPSSIRTFLCHTPRLKGRLWEPAAGRRAIVDELLADGYSVVASELRDRCVEGVTPRIDFLLEHKTPPGVETIITNPPFSIADDFIRHAIALAPTVVMFLRLAYLQGEARSDLIDPPGGLRWVYPLVERPPMMHRDGYEGKKIEGSGIPFAWFVWERGYVGDPVVRRLSWRWSEATLPPHFEDRRAQQAAGRSPEPPRCPDTLDLFEPAS